MKKTDLVIDAEFVSSWESATWLRSMGLDAIIEFGRHRFLTAWRRMKSHCHDEERLEINLFVRGNQEHRVNGVRHKLAGGDVLVVLPGDTHSGTGTVQACGSMYWAVLRLPRRCESFLGLHGAPAQRLADAVRGITIRQFKASPAFIRHMHALHELAVRRPSDETAPALATCHILGLVAELIRESRVSEASADNTYWTRRIRDFIEANTDRMVAIGEMADFMALSPSRFQARFKAELGMAPGDYAMQMRLRRAQRELCGTPPKRITDIAMAFGFSSSQHFARVFRQHFGVSATRFRRNARQVF